MKKLTLLISIFAFGLLLASCGGDKKSADTKETAKTADKKEAKVVKIGFMGPLSGAAASYGQGIKKGIEIAQKDLDKDLGMKVEIIYEDSKCANQEASSAINKLVKSDKVVAVIGEVCSGATLAAAPVAEQNKVVMISPSSTSPDISKSGDFIFRTVPSDALQGAFAADMIKKEGLSKLAILYVQDQYGEGFKKVLSAKFKELGGEVVAEAPAPPKSVDVKSQVANIQSKNPDAVFIISNSPDMAIQALKQMKELGLKAKIFGSEGLKYPKIVESPASEGLTVTAVTSGSASFLKKHQEIHKSEPGPFAAQGYDAYKAIISAVKEGAKSGPEIKDKLYKLQFDGASGSIKFDQNGDISGNYDIYQSQQGKWVKK